MLSVILIDGHAGSGFSRDALLCTGETHRP